MNRAIALDGVQISYELTYKRVKNLNIRVREDGTIGISAPPGVSEEEVEQVLREREGFLRKALEKFRVREELAPRVRTYEDGEVWYVLGVPLRLTVTEGARNAVREGGDTLLLTVRDRRDVAMRERVLHAWLTARCREVCTAVCREIYPRFQPLGVAFPEVKVRFMRSRWGSCKPKQGVVTFSRQLVEAPLACVEYVACHEFTHFLHPDHSKAFYAAMKAVLPDWKQRRNVLNTYSYRQK